MKYSLLLVFVFATDVTMGWLPRHNSGEPTTHSRLSMKKSGTPKKVVVVGGGIGGLSSAFDAQRLLAGNKKAQVHVVSERDSFQFTPSNPWVAVRKRDPKEITLPLPRILSRQGITFHHDSVTSLDPNQNELTLGDGSTVDYDFLIVATGPRLAFEEIPGLGPAGYSSSICTTPHAREAAEAVDALVASPGPVVIGAVQGASCFGPAYEFALLLKDTLYKRGGKQLTEACKITFVTSEPYIGHLGLKGAGSSRKILEKRFQAEDISWITNCSVTEVDRAYVHIQYLECKPNGRLSTTQAKLPSKFNMFIPAFRGADVWHKVPGLTDNSGMIVVNKYQQSPLYPNIFSVGICTHMDPIEPTPVPTGSPKTGYMIESMGTAAVNNICTMIDHEGGEGGELHSVPLLNGLCITDFGSDGAIFLTLPQFPPRRRDVTIDGKIATLAKIAFEKYFLHKIETGDCDPYYEKYMLHLVGVDRTTDQ